MPINFPSPPTANAHSSGYLSQPEPRPVITPDSDFQSAATLLDRLTAPFSNMPYDHLWASPSDRLTPAFSSIAAQNTPPVTENPLNQSHPAIDRAIQTLQGNYRELQHANRCELSQTRIAVERRMDDLAEAMHNDMRRLRDEALSEAATNHSDVFRCATMLGHVQDRLARLENAFNSLQDTLRSMHPAFASALPASQSELHTPTSVNPPTPASLAH